MDSDQEPAMRSCCVCRETQQMTRLPCLTGPPLWKPSADSSRRDLDPELRKDALAQGVIDQLLGEGLKRRISCGALDKGPRSRVLGVAHARGIALPQAAGNGLVYGGLESAQEGARSAVQGASPGPVTVGRQPKHLLHDRDVWPIAKPAQGIDGGK